MAEITDAVAIANNEVAFVGWRLDVWHLPGLLGFHIVREHLDDGDTVVEERPLASYVAFQGQSNPNWTPQNTTVWPVQKFTWRDLTLRQPRDGSARRPPAQRVRYRIAAVGRWRDGLEAVEVVPEPDSTYEGTPIPLGYLTAPVRTNAVTATTAAPPFTATFTNGILSTQFLLHALNATPGTPSSPDAKIPSGILESRLRTTGDSLREKLAADVLPLIRAFFDRRGGRFHAALYELDDDELVALLVKHADRVDLILSDAGSSTPDRVTTYDTRNAPAREQLAALASAPNATFTLQNRMFNGSGHIGHNKFVVHVDARGKADAVLTGSTNWTWSGVAGQSNNCIRIDDPVIAGAYASYWQRLHDDRLPDPDPLSAPSRSANQSDALKTTDRSPVLDPSGRFDDRELVLAQHAGQEAAPEHCRTRTAA